MELNDTQKQAVAVWAEQGQSLSDIQKNLRSEFGISMTYMDVRFLVLDIGCSIQDRKEAEKKAPGPAVGKADSGTDLDAEPASSGTVTVELDRVLKAGAALSGTVVFSDGVKAAWAVDNLGRMVLDPGDHEGYRPTEEDIRAFQVELKNKISSRGF